MLGAGDHGSHTGQRVPRAKDRRRAAVGAEALSHELRKPPGGLLIVSTRYRLVEGESVICTAGNSNLLMTARLLLQSTYIYFGVGHFKVLVCRSLLKE